MITMLIFGIVLTLVAGILTATLEAVERVDKIIDSGDAGPAILSLIEKDLVAAIPYPAKNPGPIFVGQDVLRGAGHADRIDFVAAVLSQGTRDDALLTDTKLTLSPVNEVGYQVRENPEAPGMFKLYRREDFSVDDIPLRGGTLYELHDRVISLNFEYYDGTFWTEQWSVDLAKTGKAKEFPKAIRITLELDEGTLEADANAEPVKGTFRSVVKMPAYQ